MSARYLVVNVHSVKDVINAIYEAGGQVLAVNPNRAAPGRAPQLREIWFLSEVSEDDILASSGIGARKLGEYLIAFREAQRP